MVLPYSYTVTSGQLQSSVDRFIDSLQPDQLNTEAKVVEVADSLFFFIYNNRHCLDEQSFASTQRALTRLTEIAPAHRTIVEGYGLYLEPTYKQHLSEKLEKLKDTQSHLETLKECKPDSPNDLYAQLLAVGAEMLTHEIASIQEGAYID